MAEAYNNIDSPTAEKQEAKPQKGKSPTDSVWELNNGCADVNNNGPGEGIDNPANLPGLTLAYMGDAVYELMVRRHFLEAGVLKVKQLHKLTIGQVCASRQALFAQNILEELSPKELDVYKRGRNAKSGHQPPNMSVTQYRRATGLEALIGYLYLDNQFERLQWLFEQLFKADADK